MLPLYLVTCCGVLGDVLQLEDPGSSHPREVQSLIGKGRTKPLEKVQRRELSCGFLSILLGIYWEDDLRATLQSKEQQLENPWMVVMPTINSPACQEQLIEAAKMVAQSVEGVVDQAAMVQSLGESTVQHARNSL